MEAFIEDIIQRFPPRRTYFHDEGIEIEWASGIAYVLYDDDPITGRFLWRSSEGLNQQLLDVSELARLLVLNQSTAGQSLV